MQNKNIMLINGGTKQFSIDFQKFSNEYNLTTTNIDAKDCIFTIINNSIRLYNKNIFIDPKKFDYSFIRLKGKDPHMTTLLTRWFSLCGVPFNDKVNLSTTLIDAENNQFNDEKITQMLVFALNNLKVPNTILFSNKSYKSNHETIANLFKFPCVVKSTGAKGKSVWKVKTQNELDELVEKNEHELLILQELLTIEYDIRTLIFNQEYLGAIKRTSTDGFYTNVSKGGTAEMISLTDEEIELSKKACQVTGIDFGGVDFARTEDGIKFFEVNKSPQIKGFQLATNINVPKRIVENIKNYLDSK